MTGFRFNSLFSRLALVLLSSFLLLALMLVWFSRQLDNNFQDEVTQRLHFSLSEHIVHEGPLFKGDEPDPVAVEKAFHNMMILGKGFEFYLLSPTGKVLNYSAPKEKIQRFTLPMTAIHEALSGQARLPLRGPDPRSGDRNKIFSVAPVVMDERLQGYLYIIINGEIYDSLASEVEASGWLPLAMLMLISGALFLLLTTLGLFAWLTRPLSRLSGAISQLQRQGFHAPALQLDSRAPAREIQQLEQAFNTLSQRLQKQYKKVKSVDEMRRELLAHVSHDLRTPLASLQGYLETWMMQHRQGQQPDPTYIDIAHQNAGKIHKMVDQLMELARLESDQVPMQMESVGIAELVQDVLQKYRPAAEAKQVLLDLHPKDPGLQVVADIEKLERVFTNLVDNALRHCQAGDTITVRFVAASDALEVSVSDSGIGIPASDLPHIFDAHYKAANSIRGDSAHSGLGLAITKRLLALHRSQIEVSSQVQQGTEFRFQLQWA
ncbi:cell wall metabolism sensor histidine kinase WalK [Ferrimonas sp. SCSIO 43195]|uniref:sensor histidine kinase n=1 Tax=Ferrimonas sp. SCSIO 43195 TaxID=2822844 RepID=UPI002074BA5F|nr:HAMP domain-containing sensor histidine kinase [Ferrimonas sp. SCSIO 43195]USD38034.1 HAMP domain-containing histidine kinase [Ferrimonas sp. SCSIO 43195]